MATTTFRVYNCVNQSNEGQLGNPPFVATQQWGTCANGTGSWKTITITDPPMFDVASMLIVLVLCIMLALGFIAGQQR